MKSQMKVSILQDTFLPGAWEDNHKKIREFYQNACREKADIAVLPSDAISGYGAQGLLDYMENGDKIARLQKKLIKETTEHTALVFDTPFALDGSFSPLLMVAWGGCIRFFTKQFAEVGEDVKNRIFQYKGMNIWPTYLSGDTALHAAMSEDTDLVDLAILLDARPFMADKEEERLNVLEEMSRMFKQTLYVAQCGGQAGEVLTGASAFFKKEECLWKLPYFKPMEHTFNIEDKRKTKVKSFDEIDETALIHDAIVCGLRDYCKQNGIKKVVLGLSGGIDSAVVLPLAVEALGRQNVFGLMMPSRFSSDHSLNDAVKEADNLQIHYEIIQIEPLYATFLKQLAPIFKGTPFGLAEENLQARIRGNLLMSVANKTGAMLLNTSNKSEAACGYGTMYGDLCGGLSLIGDLYKSQVYDLAKYINRKKEIIPKNCLTKAPSAELRPNQKDSDSLPPYDLIEAVMRMHLEEQREEKDIVKEGIDKAMVRKVLDLFYKNEYKRRQTPPVIRLSNTVLAQDTFIPLGYKRG